MFGADHLGVAADRGYFNSPEILACQQAGITVTTPPMTSGAQSNGRFGKRDFPSADRGCVCPAGDKRAYRYANARDGEALRRSWTTTGCSSSPWVGQFAWQDRKP
jgi:hypothetical protein